MSSAWLHTSGHRATVTAWARRFGPFALVVVLAAVYYALYIPRLPFELADEGYHDLIAQLLHHGAVLYRDVELNNYLPGIFFFFSAVFGLLGDSVRSARLADIVGLVLAAGLTYSALVQLVERRWQAVVLSTVVLCVPGPFYKFYVRLLQLAVLAVALRLLRDVPRPRRWWVAAGLLTGVGFCIRMDIGYTGAVLLALAALLGPQHRGWRWRSLGLATLAMFLAMTPLLLVLAREGVAPSYLQRFVSVWTSATQRSLSHYRVIAPPLAGLVHGRPSAWLFWGSLVVPLALGTQLGVGWWRRRGRGGAWSGAAAHPVHSNAVAAPGDGAENRLKGGASRALLLVWLVMNVPQYALARPDGYHFTQQSFAWLLVLGVLVFDALAAAHGRRRRWPLWGAASLAGAFLLFVPGVLIALGQPWTIGALQKPTHPVQLQDGRRYRASAHDTAAPLYEAILANTPPNASVAALPYLPGINFLLRRPLPGHQPYVLPMSSRRQGAVPKYIAALEAQRTPVVVYAHLHSTNGRPDGVLKAYAPRLDHYLWQHYQLLASEGDRLFMVRAGDPSERSPDVADASAVRAALARGRLDAALTPMMAALQHASYAPETHLLLALLAARRGDAITLQHAYQTAAALAQAQLQLAGTTAQQRSHLRGLAAAAELGLGRWQLGRGKTQLAAASFQNAMTLVPADAQPATWLGRAQLQADQPRAALQAFDAALARQPHAAAALDGKGRCLLRLNQRQAAATVFEQAADADANDAVSRLILGRMALQDDDLDRAEAYDQAAAQLAPKAAGPWSQLAEIARRRGDIGQASVLSCRAASLRKPPAAGAWVLCARQSVVAGHVQQARLALRAARQLDPRRAATAVHQTPGLAALLR